MSRPRQMVEYRGEWRSLLDLAREHGKSPSSVRCRIDVLGWTIEEALNTPIGATGRPRKGAPPKVKPKVRRSERAAALEARRVQDVDRMLDEAVRREHAMPWERAAVDKGRGAG